MFPLSLKVLFNCLFGKNSYARLKITGMEYFTWILLKAVDKQIQHPISLILKKGISKLIADDPKPTKKVTANNKKKETKYRLAWPLV
eukprot:TRINITY_DN13103_c0_g1_i1.p1 TRINITY_DN13103_c0_g1~~TRINITY_DN13103_c0_g1_i1.p1  ORF type:complete len:87 (+),score=12.48 TRINITY_DN13103_c0_g1_i1:159-419(+)